jgi:segregation and condensation protein B
VKKAQPTGESRENRADAADASEAEDFEEPIAEEASGESGEALEEPSAAGESVPEPDGAVADQPMLPHLLPNPTERRALLEAIVYVAEEPLGAAQIAQGLGLPEDLVQADLEQLVSETQAAARGIEIRQVAGGYKMFTKAEHHDTIRQFVKTLRPKLRLSLPALETLAVIAYKQPVTVPEIQAIRGVNAGGVIHTLLNHKLITTAGRKKVIGRPMQYKTTKEFLVQFGLNDLSELPNLKELEELSRAALGEGEEPLPIPANGAVSANGTGLEEDSGVETELAGASEEAADEQELTAPQTAAASAAAAGAGRAASTPIDLDSDEDTEG